MNIVTMSLTASLTILVVIIIRLLFIHTLPKKTFLLLWSVVIFRLMVPVSIPSRLSIWNIADAFFPSAPLTEAAEETVPAFAAAAPAAFAAQGNSRESIMEATVYEAASFLIESSAASVPKNLSVLFRLWLTGLLLCAIIFLLPHLRWRGVYKTALPAENIFIKQWAAGLSLKRKLSVKLSDRVNTPLTYGILKPVILLPKVPDFQDETCLLYVLTHEYVHIRRFDTFRKWALAFTLAVHWFNPLVWIMYILANRDIELSCDEAVVRIHENNENIKSSYAMTLLGLEESRSAWMSLCANFSRNMVEERIVSIMKIKRRSLISIAAAVFLAGGITLVFATSKTEAEAAEMQSAGNVWEITSSSAAESQPYRERMLFVTKGENTLKVTYDGETWEAYTAVTENENWRWYSYEEYAEHIEYIKNARYDICTGSYADFMISSMRGAETDPAKLRQTLEDIKNGIKVSRPKMIYITHEAGPKGDPAGWIHWYCYGYVFKDKAGNKVDLGLFETRDALFAALKQYCDTEVSAGRLTQREAARLFGKISHKTRNTDEEPLANKLRC